MSLRVLLFVLIGLLAGPSLAPAAHAHTQTGGMLGTLDPHSSFFDPREYAQMRERQEGRYYGLGITIASIDGDITAQSVFEGSPAFKAGVRRGDVIATIDADSAKGWTTEQTVGKLRGPKGTFVNIGIRRKGFEALLPMRVMRDQVSIPSLSAVFMIDAQTGYVGVTDFAEHTDDILRELGRSEDEIIELKIDGVVT